MTGSSVIFSDAAESVVHIIAVWFAWYALRVTERPPDAEHHYGHEKISFVSAGVEGSLICIAAVVIIVSAVTKLVVGIQLERLELGTIITAGAGLVNTALGVFLVRTGRKSQSLVVEANGRHVLTDAWTSAGAVGGLLLANYTGILWIDPVMAILFAANIMREGLRLVTTSVNGLMDRSDEALESAARVALDAFVADNNLSYHRFRLRMVGLKPFVDFHLQFPDTMPMNEAHALATDAEEAVRSAMRRKEAEIFTHLEPTTVPEDHT